MKLAMLATTAIATTALLIPVFSVEAAEVQKCDDMLSIRDVVILCQTNDRTQEINEIYREVLGRDADTPGLKTWTRKLRRTTLKRVRREIAQSTEAKNALNRIYQEVLGRNVDPGGLETYTKNLAKSWSLSDVRRDIQDSEEAMSRRLSAS
jgi:hypothetical protein